MFVPSEQVIIALEDGKTSLDVFKEFQDLNPKDKITMETLDISRRSIEVIYSPDLEKNFIEYLKNYSDVNARPIINLIKTDKKIKLFYVTPKEILKLLPGSNISMLQYQGSYLFTLESSSGEIYTFIQATKPIIGMDEHMFEIVFDAMMKEIIKHIFKHGDISENLIENEKIIRDYNNNIISWYTNLVETIIDRYNFMDISTKEAQDEKDRVIQLLSSKLISIIKKVDMKSTLNSTALLNFFKGTIISCNDMVSSAKSKNIKNFKNINAFEHRESVKKYLKEFYIPLERIFKNKIFQPEVILANKDFGIIIEVVNHSYSKTFNDVIDFSHYTKKSALQEFYHYHTIAHNYFEFKNDTVGLLNVLKNNMVFEGTTKKGKNKSIKIKRIRKVCLEISGVTPAMIKNSGDMEEIELSGDDGELLKTGYTSSYVKNIFKDQIIKRSKKFESVSDALCKLIDDDVITPVTFTDSDDYNILVQNYPDMYGYEKRIMGFYENDRNRIFLMLNNISIGGMGSVANSSIMSLILHELMHYAYQNLLKDYMTIFNTFIQNFYKTFFNNYFDGVIPDKIIQKYVMSLYRMEKNGESRGMIGELNNVLSYAQENLNPDVAFMNSKAFEKLFLYLADGADNNTGMKIAKLSKSFFNESMKKAYTSSFSNMNKDIMKRVKSQNSNVEFQSVFYQEFIATSEVAAILAGTLVKEIYKQQHSLDKDHPIAKMINSL